MHDVALDILSLLAGIWLVAVTLRPLGVPTVMGELIVGVLVGPAVFGLIEPSEAHVKSVQKDNLRDMFQRNGIKLD